MKTQFTIVLLLALCFNTLIAQRRGEGKDVKEDKSLISTPVETVTAKAAVSINMNDIPEKWKNESAVIMFQKLNFSYFNQRRGNNLVNETVSRKIKLLDKASVTDFSEFYFYESERDERLREKKSKKGEDVSKIKLAVIKPSGERVKVNISDAVKVDNEVPQFYRSYYVGDKIYKKIAIPNLNVGDVLEYQLEIDYNKVVDGVTTFHAFPAFYKTLANKYPVMKQEFNFMLEQGFYLNLNSYNGAPKFKRLDYGYDEDGEKTTKMRTFQIIDEDREKLPQETMSLPNTFYPSVKLQVVAKSSDNAVTQGSSFTGEQDVAKNTISPEEVAQRFNRDYRQSAAFNIDKFAGYAYKLNLKTKPLEEKAKTIFGYVKYIFARDVSYDPYGKNTMLDRYERALYPIKDFYFATYMSKCLEEMEMEHEVIAVMPRNAGKINDLLLGEEITWIVKVNNGSKPLYFYPMNSYTTSDVNREPYLYGGEGYAFTPSTKRKAGENATARKVAMPIPPPSVNTLKTKYVAAFDDQLEKLTVTRDVEATGVLKGNYTSYTTLGYDFLTEYEKRYTRDYKEPKESKNKKKSKEDLAYEESLKKLAEKQKEFMHDDLKSDFDDIASYDEFELKNAGVLEENPTLAFKDKFKLNNLLSKAGRNYTLELGKILSKEPKLDDDDLKTRQSDIQMNFPKTLVYELELTLPTGYTIEDLKDINLNIDNVLMSYKVESQLVGDKLSVKTTKVYKKINAPKTEWQKIVDVFTAAFDFSQKKVVLKKK
jgi:hypothetical protein